MPISTLQPPEVHTPLKGHQFNRSQRHTENQDPHFSAAQKAKWLIIQTISWLTGAAIFVSLIVYPDVGLQAFWNILIPCAPAMFAFIPGTWRNLCPLGSTALLPRRLGIARPDFLSFDWQTRLGLVGIALLLFFIPFRHVALNLNGPATALTLAVLAISAIIAGTLFEWKSGWCSGACPVFQIEKLYGSHPALTVPNAHCTTCDQCTAPCIDSSTKHYSFTRYRDTLRNLTTLFMFGGFPGFIWGWFQVPDYTGAEGWNHLVEIYGYPLGAGGITCLIFLGFHRFMPSRFHIHLIQLFVAGAISCYYWFRLPALVGFGIFPGDGMLVDLTTTLPEWSVWVSRTGTTSLFFWWFFRSQKNKQPWTIRPRLAELRLFKRSSATG
ncbi:MAG: hypothetical protein VST68_13155 [Nitrospirota bacterium]|nr:hypothetical protein [Nitrospirota bacterium]